MVFRDLLVFLANVKHHYSQDLKLSSRPEHLLVSVLCLILRSCYVQEKTDMEKLFLQKGFLSGLCLSWQSPRNS
jgi:hypothetical protein